MRRRSLFFYLILVFIVAFAGVGLALQLLGNSANSASGVPRLITVEVKITTTPVSQTPVVIIVTPTLLPGQVPIPAGLQVQSTTTTGEPAATLDATLVAGGVPLNQNQAAPGLPANCLQHTIEDGDTPFGIAAEYGANPFELLEVNGLTEETATLLQIGEVLIVPLEGCNILPPPTATPEETEEAPTATPTPGEAEQTAESEFSPTPSPSPTITLEPTASNAEVEILEVLNPGDVTAEGVRLFNNGRTLRVDNWTMSDAEGNVYTFPAQVLFSESELTVFTRAGQNTAIVLFWGRDEAAFQPGDIVTLRDAEGNVQSTLRLSAPVELR